MPATSITHRATRALVRTVVIGSLFLAVFTVPGTLIALATGSAE